MSSRLARFICVLFGISCCLTACARRNILANGGMNVAGPGELPPHWRPLVISTPATFAADTGKKHEGRSSIRIDAAESTRSYIVSDPIPVAPGEQIHGSAWVKVRDVPAKPGTVIMIAAFDDPSALESTVAKFNVADIAKASRRWQKIDGTVKVPTGAVALRVRLGFSYSKGTCWWDDVKVSTTQPVAARIDIPEPRLSPAMKTLPILLINHDAAKETVRVNLALNKKTAAQSVALSGEPAQRIDLPIDIPPHGKVTAKVSVLRGSTTRPAFAFESEVQVPLPIVLPPISPTHWVIEDGPARIDGRIDLAASDALRGGATVRVDVRDRLGKSIASWSNQGKPVPDGITEFSIDAASAEPGYYTVVAQLIPRKGKPLVAEQPWHVIPRRLAHVTINRDGYPEYDGNAIFPLGVFNGGKFPEQADAGFTVTHSYNATRISPGPRPQDAEAKRFLDQSEANGMKMLLMVPMRPVIQGDWETVRRRVRMFRNHPALLAWDEEEGFGRGDFHSDTLKQLRKLLQEEDPNHPFMVGDPKDVIGHMGDRSNFFPLDEMDMGMWWWYPFPLMARAGDALEGEEASAADELAVPTFFTLATTDKPLWLGVQSYKKDAKSRYPTPEEYRGQAYLAVAAGAKGLMWYGGSVTGGLYLDPDAGHFDALKKVVYELQSLSPLLMGKTLESPTISPANAPLTVTLKQSPDRTILIAVNRSIKPIDVTISSGQIKSANLPVLYENRTIDADSNSFKDHFAPFAAHVYELTP